MLKPMDEKEIVSLLTFNSFSYKSIKFYTKLKEDFGTLYDAFKNADLSYFLNNKFPSSFVDEFLAKRALEFGKNELDRVNKYNVRITTIESNDYPVMLNGLHNAPLVLYIKGEVIADSVNFAIVGTRNPSGYGVKMAEKFALELSRIGFCIVSGFARGIDTVVHTTCLKNKSRTYCVLGSGLLNIYPPENRNLVSKVVEYGGALISEFPLDTQPLQQNFPARNRIISGLSLGTLVVEAGIDSGALITASWAIEQNRELFVIPHRIDTSAGLGCLKLAQEGAKIVVSAQDILDEFPALFKTTTDEKKSNKVSLKLSDTEKAVLETIGNEILSFDEIFYKVSLPLQKLNLTLLELEVKGLIKKLPGNRYSKS
ncbi:MAG: DNA-processing protein DprA [Planctomycetota bacterium]